jgi:hypothetical protein
MNAATASATTTSATTGSGENERGCSGDVGGVVAERVEILADDFRPMKSFYLTAPAVLR